LTADEVDRMHAANEKNAKQGMPLRVSVPIKTHISSLEQGIWTNLRGKRVWLLEIKSENATQLAPIFNNLHFAIGAEMWLFNKDKTLLMGPITTENIPQKAGKTMTDFLPSESITVVYFAEKTEDELIVEGVDWGYDKAAGFGMARICNVDVSNTPADCFKFEQNAVAVLLKADDHGTAVCTGTMINNTAQDFRPFVLTANHCFNDVDGISNPSAMRIRFKWQTGITIPQTNGTFQGHVTFVGANRRASSFFNADFGLLELFVKPEANTGITYLGWSRIATPQLSTILHHPVGDFMKITRDAQPAVPTTASNGGTRIGDRGWRVTLFGPGDFGITEQGSSGSALLNENRLICGQLQRGMI
jgi:hypothetical protein